MKGRTAAVFSPCGAFRYRLERTSADLVDAARARTLTVVMVNPSTADEHADDPTIRKVQGFALRAGFNRVIVGNLFAFRSTDIKGLARVADPRGGRRNLEELARMIGEADALLFAWGPVAKVPRQWRGRWMTVADLAEKAGKIPLCLGTAQDGQPRHPLMVAYAQPLEPWIRPR
ncbi:MAG: DUF1643 domain-containing protein [Thermoleophilia bacterium]|nr:DUF1643 domain-containing protein [Thermoleophilia bacterium]